MRIGAGARHRLGHGEAGPDLARRERKQVPRALRLAGHLREQVHVAFVGRGGIERLRAEEAAPRFLEHHRDLAPGQPQPAQRLGEGGKEDAGRLGFLLQLPADFFQRGHVAQLRLARNHLRLDELAHALPQRGQLRTQVEIDHGFFSSSTWRAVSRRRNFCTLPVEVLGNSPKTTLLGALKCASTERACSMSPFSDNCAPGFRETKATGTSPHFWSGPATTAASSTAGCAASARSTSSEEMFSPPEMMMSLARSFSSTYPSGCITPKSPLRNQPSGAARRVGPPARVWAGH